eukprot:1155672-Pelagomonas_calceolata.AAC.11
MCSCTRHGPPADFSDEGIVQTSDEMVGKLDPFCMAKPCWMGPRWSFPPMFASQRCRAPLGVQVQTSDEVGSGLRRLRGCPMLALERFKSIQKRGLVEPRKRNGPKGPKRLCMALQATGVWQQAPRGPLGPHNWRMHNVCCMGKNAEQKGIAERGLVVYEMTHVSNVEYEKQARRERALEGQAELLELQKANKQKKGKNRWLFAMFALEISLGLHNRDG